jgi:predicted nucleic acid-binding protein
LEVFPKVALHAFPLQRAFLNEFFMEPSLEWASDLNAVVDLAVSESERHGLSAMDALHVAAALALKADQLITTEKPGKPIYRADGVQVVYVDTLEQSTLQN